MRGIPCIPVRLVCHFELVVLPYMLVILLVRRLSESSSIIWRAILKMRRREVWRRVGECAGRYVVLMIWIPALPTHPAMLLMMIVHMV